MTQVLHFQLNQMTENIPITFKNWFVEVMFFILFSIKYSYTFNFGSKNKMYCFWKYIINFVPSQENKQK